MRRPNGAVLEGTPSDQPSDLLAGRWGHDLTLELSVAQETGVLTRRRLGNSMPEAHRRAP